MIRSIRKRGSSSLRKETSREATRLIAIGMSNINPESMRSSHQERNRIEILVEKEDRVVIGKCKEMKTWMISILIEKANVKINSREGNNSMLRSKLVANGKNHSGRMRGQGWMKIYQER